VVLLDLKVTRVHDNGLSETFVQRVVRVQDESGAGAQQWQGVQYSPDTQTVDLREARVYKPSGEIVEATSGGTREVSEPWYGLYYDVRSEMVGFEKLEPGDVLEYSYVLSDVGRRNLYADYFGDVYFFAESVPVAEAEYTLLHPRSREMHWRLPALSGLSRKDDVAGGEQRTRLTAQKLAKIQTDPAMPGWTEAAPYVHVSTWKSWDQVARWYWRLVEEQLATDDSVKKAAAEATRGATDEKSKVRGVHNWVVKNTRYVGLEFGIHSFKPYRVPQILERKFGDCKDKASLIVVLLREVGIPAQLVLVRTRKNGDVDDVPASLALFDHAIAYVPSLDLYLDGTAEYSGSTELPYQDQGVMVLRIDGGDGLLTRTPVHPADSNLTQRTLRIELAADGKATIDEGIVIVGQSAAGWRQYYQTAGERLSRYEKSWNASLPGFKLDRVDMPGLADLEKPVTVSAHGSVPQLGGKNGKGFTLPPLSYASELARALTRGSKRDHDLLLDNPWVQSDRVEWTLPPGARVVALPAPVKIAGKHGSLEITVEQKQQGGRELVIVQMTLRFEVYRIPVGEYAEFREFLGKIDAARNQPIEYAL
jgi:transglutaminase-like putative cysteine protease